MGVERPPPAHAIQRDESPFASRYLRYIRSSDWARRRTTYFASHPRRCAACGDDAKPIHLHHLAYYRLGHELDSDLLALCRPCHELVHRVYKSTRTGTLRQSSLQTVKLITSNGRYEAAVALPGGITELAVREPRRKPQPAKRPPPDGPRKGALLAEARTGRRAYTSREWHEHWLRSRRRRRR